MLRRSIPGSGESLPLLGLGTWRTFDVGNAQSARAPLLDVLGRLIDAGGAVIDSSPMYGRAESTVGDLLATLGERARTFIATKVWTEGRAAGVEQLMRSLQLLQVQQLDLVQIHNLVDWKVQLGTLREWQAAGRLRYVGITHYHRDAHAELAAIMRSEPLDFVQFNYALDDRAAEQLLLPLAAERGIAVLINRPFGEGATLRRLARTP
jgi:aryl-alcohol dehydrogenase-like predicted oxidoreductase